MAHIGRIKVVKEADDIMDTICVCPHCGEHVLYGQMMMLNGIHECPMCCSQLYEEIKYDKSLSYDLYAEKNNHHDYEPYRYKGDD